MRLTQMRPPGVHHQFRQQQHRHGQPAHRQKVLDKNTAKMPTATKPAIIAGLKDAKSEIDSLLTFHTNHAVPSSISATPSGRLRGNLRAVAANFCGW